MFNKAKLFGGFFTKVYKPTITSPTASQIVGSRTPTITSSAFSKYGNITHASSDWQVSDASDFNTIRWSSSDDTSNKTSITSSDLAGGDRYVRVRYKSNTGIYSDWSDAVLFTSPWATGTGVLVSSTVFELPTSAPVTIQSGTYRITLWGGGGGGAAGGGNGSRSGGGAGSVSKDVTYPSPTSIPFSIGLKGGYASQNSGGGYGGSPGGGDGGNAGGGIQWCGGGGGGYSSAIGMIAAGGGGSGGDGGGPGGPGGSGDSSGGSAGGSGNSGNSGNGYGGGGGGSNEGNKPQGGPGGGGSNSGSYSNGYSSPGTVAANRYYSSTSSYYYGDADTNGGARIQKIAAQVTPVVSITSNLSSTASSTAGSSSSFSITATDTANNDSTVAYQWYVSTDGGSNYSAISGQNAQTLTRYQPFYYSDNGHKIKCRATVTNSVTSSYTDSTVCTLTVARNYDCSGATVTGTLNLSSSGPKSSTNGNGDDTWGTWSPGYDDICEINGSTNSFNVKGRFCNWQAKLELRITKSTDGTRRHWGDQTRSGTQDNYQNFQLNANGGGWDPGNDGIPTFRLMIVDSDTQCQDGNQDIGAEQETTVTLSYSYKRRTYYYDSRP
jgi:hypothetical protein